MEFLKEVSWREADRFLKLAKKKGLSKQIFLITEWGAVGIQDKARVVVDLGDEDDKRCFIATMGFLQKSEDGMFVRLMKNGEKIKLPNFKDIFEFKSDKDENIS